MLLLSWPCLAGVTGAVGLWWNILSADLIVFPPVVVLVAIWAD